MKEKGATVMTKEERLRYWQGIIEQYRASGLSGAAFCKEHNINAGRFYHWRRRLSDGNDFTEREEGLFNPYTFPSIPRLLEPWFSPNHSFLDSGLILYLLAPFITCGRFLCTTLPLSQSLLQSGLVLNQMYAGCTLSQRRMVL